MSRPNGANTPVPTGWRKRSTTLTTVPIASRSIADRFVRGKRGHEPDRARRRARRLQHAERQRDQRGARARARRRAAERAARDDLDAARRPSGRR